MLMRACPFSNRYDDESRNVKNQFFIINSAIYINLNKFLHYKFNRENMTD